MVTIQRDGDKRGVMQAGGAVFMRGIGLVPRQRFAAVGGVRLQTPVPPMPPEVPPAPPAPPIEPPLPDMPPIGDPPPGPGQPSAGSRASLRSFSSRAGAGYSGNC